MRLRIHQRLKDNAVGPIGPPQGPARAEPQSRKEIILKAEVQDGPPELWSPNLFDLIPLLVKNNQSYAASI